MKTLTLWQPWASFLAHGVKKIETRSWLYRGPLPAVLAIHAGKAMSHEVQALLAALVEGRPFRRALMAMDKPLAGNLPLGAVVGAVRLVECVSTSLLATPIAAPCLARRYLDTFPEERHFGDYRAGRYAWACDRFKFLDAPIPIKGARGLWNWQAPPDLEEWAQSVLAETDLPKE